MIMCPVCGYSEQENVNMISTSDLQKKRWHDIFMIHALSTWWISQPRWVWNELKRLSICPKNILDIGCGDGRWLPGLREIFPKSGYLGIDRLSEHILLNCENIPEEKWLRADFTDLILEPKYDCVLFGGTFNPKMIEEKEKHILEKTKELNPTWIICLYDLNQSGYYPHSYISDKYELVNTLTIPKDEMDERQHNVVWIFENQNGSRIKK